MIRIVEKEVFKELNIPEFVNALKNMQSDKVIFEEVWFADPNVKNFAVVSNAQITKIAGSIQFVGLGKSRCELNTPLIKRITLHSYYINCHLGNGYCFSLYFKRAFNPEKYFVI